MVWSSIQFRSVRRVTYFKGGPPKLSEGIKRSDQRPVKGENEEHRRERTSKEERRSSRGSEKVSTGRRISFLYEVRKIL